MATHPRPSSWSAAWFLSFLLTACNAGDAPPRTREVDSLFHGDIAAVTRIGNADDPVRSFTRIVDVAASPDGSRVVVLDASPPFVRLFDREGRDRAFLQRGDGPGESRGPWAVAAGADGFLILDRAPKLFDWGGALVAEGRLPGFIGLAAIAGCKGDWLVYGPGQGQHEFAWLHSLNVTAPDSFSDHAWLADTARPRRIGLGALYGLSRGAGRFVLYHTNGSPPGLMQWSCENPEPQSMPDLAFLVPPPPETTVEPTEGGVMISGTIGFNVPSFAGLAWLDEALLWIEHVMIVPLPGKEPDVETRLRLVENGIEYSATVQGDFTLRGSTAEGTLLFTTIEPWPQVLLVDGAALRAALLQARRRVLDAAS